MKKLLSVIAIVLAVLSLSACSVLDSLSSKEKQYSTEGMTITMPGGFYKTEQEGFKVCYARDDCAVFALREGFDELEGLSELTLDEYADLVLENNELDKPVNDGAGLKYFEFERDVKDDNGTETFSYLACCYRAGDAFWLVQFSCPKSKYGENRSDMLAWAETVTFSE